jgi:hypothetical protein
LELGVWDFPLRYGVLLVIGAWSLAFGVDPRYHHYGQTVAELNQLVQQHPGICRLDTIGFTTTNDSPLIAIKFSDNPSIQEDEPRVLYNGVHHACELIGNEICLFMAHDLAQRYGSDPNVTRWIDSNQIFLVPVVNPDGHEINMSDQDTTWRKNLHDFNHNGIWDPDTDGVDLNRNYDFIWEAGDPNQGSRYYRGESAFSEIETRAIRNLARREKFVFDICWHSDIDPVNGQTVYYPWRWGNFFCPDYPEVKTIADSVARRIIADNGVDPYATIYGRATEGGLARNWLYYDVGTFAYTIEVSTGYQYPGPRVDSLCRRVLPGAYYLLERTYGSGLTGHVLDSASGLPLVAEVKVLEATSTPDTIRPRMSDSVFGRFWRLLKPDTYTVEVSKYGYVTQHIGGVLVRPDTLTALEVSLSRDQGIEDEQYLRPGGLALYLNQRPYAARLVGISYRIPRAGPVRLAVFDQTGRQVRELVNRQILPGTYGASWNGLADHGIRAAQGVYFVRLTCGQQGITRKLVLTGKQ